MHTHPFCSCDDMGVVGEYSSLVTTHTLHVCTKQYWFNKTLNFSQLIMRFPSTLLWEGMRGELSSSLLSSISIFGTFCFVLLLRCWSLLHIVALQQHHLTLASHLVDKHAMQCVHALAEIVKFLAILYAPFSQCTILLPFTLITSTSYGVLPCSAISAYCQVSSHHRWFLDHVPSPMPSNHKCILCGLQGTGL